MAAVLRALAIPAGVACLMLLAACGGSGTTMGSITFGNNAPVFTSPASVTVLEDTSGVFYTAAARDDDGETVTFSIFGGEDASLFRITTTGGLSFVAPPDFEQPADFGRDNEYRVQIAASDGFARTTLNVSVFVTDRQSASLRVRRIGFGFAAPVFIAPVPDNSSRVFVGELAGQILLLDTTTGVVNPQAFLDLRGQLDTNGERGLLGFATAPDYATTGNFYVFVTDPVGTLEIRRYRTSTANRNVADPATMQVLLRQPHPRSNHNGGWIAFGPDGFLYVAIGDGGGSGDPDNNGQNPDTLLGKILRIDVTRDDFQSDPTRNYGIPSTNPFRVAGGAPEVWALGLRNPFRASFDDGPGGTGILLIGDVGENLVEEVDLMTDLDGGANFGWSQREGTQAFKGADSPAFTPPVAEYLHGTGTREGDTVIGGIVYRGPVESLRGQYIFGDFVRGNLWSIPLASLRDGRTVPSAEFTVRNADFAPDVGAYTNITSFGADLAGNLYITDMDGELFVLEAAPSATPDRPIRAARSAPTATPYWCIEEWDGHTIRWRGNEVILAGEGLTCVRKHYEELERKGLAPRREDAATN
jgi:glucose/arabinose dehydrogenase